MKKYSVLLGCIIMLASTLSAQKSLPDCDPGHHLTINLDDGSVTYSEPTQPHYLEDNYTVVPVARLVSNEVVPQRGKVPVVKTQNPQQVIEGIKNAKSWTDLLGIESALYTLLITIGGYISFLIPGINKIPSATWRVLSFAILVIGGSLVIGIGDVWQGAIAYLFSTSLYEVILKWFIKTPKPDTTA